MITISVCMIVKNEEAVLGRCLDSVKDIADEIIIVDTGSSDATKEIASRYTNNIYEFEWIDDFAAARNYSFSKATKDYIMWLDADDIMLQKDQLLLQELKRNLEPTISMVMMKYNTAFDKNDRPTFTYYRERLVQRKMDFRWEGAIHEVIAQRGAVMHADIAVTHKKLNRNDANRNLRIFQKMLARGETLEPRMEFYYGRELMYHQDYENAIKMLEHFLSSGKGWIENNIDACRDLSACYRQSGNEVRALESLFYSFKFDEPRAEVCCDIGAHFEGKKQYQLAIYWYQTAAAKSPNFTTGGFCSIDCYHYIPFMQLCVCYDRIGDYKKAYEYHQKAKECKPDDPGVQFNERYFQTVWKKTGLNM